MCSVLCWRAEPHLPPIATERKEVPHSALRMCLGQIYGSLEPGRQATHALDLLCTFTSNEAGRRVNRSNAPQLGP